MSKIGRNDPCPCGSKLKFKHCHGDELKTAIAKRIANQAMLLMVAETRCKKELITKEELGDVLKDFNSLVIQFIKPFNQENKT